MIDADRCQRLRRVNIYMASNYNKIFPQTMKVSSHEICSICICISLIVIIQKLHLINYLMRLYSN